LHRGTDPSYVALIASANDSSDSLSHSFILYLDI
jgi:hypothetical protein